MKRYFHKFLAFWTAMMMLLNVFIPTGALAIRIGSTYEGGSGYPGELHIRLNFNGGTKTIASDAKLYLFVKMEKSFNWGTDYRYFLTKIETSGQNVWEQTVQFVNQNSAVDDYCIYGGNEPLTIEILNATGNELSFNDAYQGTAGKFTVIQEGGVISGYTVDFGDTLEKVDHEEGEYTDKYYYDINLDPIVLSQDISAGSVLGSGIYYGITAQRFEQPGHIQSNFATNYYVGGNYVEPDLAGNAGAIIIADGDIHSINGVNNLILALGQSIKNDVSVYLGKGNASNVQNVTSHTVIVESDSTYLTNNFVNPIINHGVTVSDNLVTKNATIQALGIR